MLISITISVFIYSFFFVKFRANVSSSLSEFESKSSFIFNFERKSIEKYGYNV